MLFTAFLQRYLIESVFLDVECIGGLSGRGHSPTLERNSLIEYKMGLIGKSSKSLIFDFFPGGWRVPQQYRYEVFCKHLLNT